MKPEIISSIGAFISVVCAIALLYLYRSQGKGFVWTKDHKINIGVLQDGKLDLAIEIPIFNLGRGAIKFLRLRAKKVYLKNNSVENFDLAMDEAYFPEGVEIVKYRTPIYSDFKDEKTKLQSKLHVVQIQPVAGQEVNVQDLQNVVNQKLEDIGEVILILRCEYKDGSWFGWKTKTTTISLINRGVDMTYLSPERRKELNNLFS